jgi:ABC-type transporter Mla subunit MlaD
VVGGSNPLTPTKTKAGNIFTKTLPALEKTFATFRQEAGAHIKETEENTTIMLGVIRSQGQDSRKIFQRLETMDEHLNSIDGRMNTIEQHLDRLETKFDEHTALLTQILARLPKTP